MLDHCSILTTGGFSLWSRSYTSSPSPFDSFVRDALVDELGGKDERWDAEGYTVRWTRSVEQGLIFVVSDWMVSIAYILLISHTRWHIRGSSKSPTSLLFSPP
jgi:hypothetical protein